MGAIVEQTVKTTCPRDCYDSCGIVASVRPDGTVRVSGDPDHPVARGSLCAKCGVAYNGVFQDTAARLTTALRRTGPKGSGKFEPVGLDTAIDEVGKRLSDVIAERGPADVLTMNYSGTMSLVASGFPNRFVNAIGASVVDYGTICNRAGCVAWELLFGTARIGFDPRTAKDSACIMVWGANPAHSAPHAHQHWLKETPAQVIVVDPVRTRTARDADLHLAPRPGTDAALAFGILHALDELGAFDRTFIEDRVLGADEVEGTIKSMTLERAEQLTGVSAAEIRRAAELYASGPALLWCGQGLQRQARGGNIMRAVGLLPALTGNVGKPGAGFYYLNDVAEHFGVDWDWLEGSALRQSPGRTVGGLDLATRLADADEFGAFMVWNTNPVASAADSALLQTALGREDLFTVAIDLFLTDTARYADIVLPAASFLEFDDLTAGYFNLALGAQTKVIDPPGDALPNQALFRRLAASMVLDEPQLFETDAAIVDELLRQAGWTGDFAALKSVGEMRGGDDPYIAFDDHAFPTPSGRIEVASASAEAMGLDRVPDAGVDPAPAAGRVRLLSPASRWRLNDSYANDPRLRRRSSPPEITLHPDDAERFGVGEGQVVRVGNRGGELMLTARIADDVLPGTAISYKGRWPSLEAEGHNLNLLYDGAKSDIGESSTVHSIEVTVAPAG
jgi:anaerobic selenocysteine-containing dehydrogenase